MSDWIARAVSAWHQPTDAAGIATEESARAEYELEVDRAERLLEEQLRQARARYKMRIDAAAGLAHARGLSIPERAPVAPVSTPTTATDPSATVRAWADRYVLPHGDVEDPDPLCVDVHTEIRLLLAVADAARELLDDCVEPAPARLREAVRRYDEFVTDPHCTEI